MVLLARSLPRYARPISSRASCIASAARFSSHARPAASVRGSLTSRAALASKSNSLAPFNSHSVGAPASIRLLTTQREKVKVLAVLYDGGEHAKQVCRTSQSPSHIPVKLAKPQLSLSHRTLPNSPRSFAPAIWKSPNNRNSWRLLYRMWLSLGKKHRDEGVWGNRDHVVTLSKLSPHEPHGF
jgi:hypothetical protein